MKKNVVLVTLENAFRGISIRYLSSWIKQLGHSCRLLFTCRQRGTFQDLKHFTAGEIDAVIHFLKENKTDMVGMTVMTGDFLPAVELAGRIRERLSGIKIVFGGIHPTLMPGECIAAGIDYVVIGDGEYPLQNMLEDVPVSSIDGIAYAGNGGCVMNKPDKNRHYPLEKLPFPDYDFTDHYFIEKGSVRNLDAQTYRKRTAWGGDYYYLTTSRGCPYRCAYCCNYNRMSPRRNSVDRVMEELRSAREKMPFIKGVNIQDDSFYMGSDEYIEEFCRRLKDEFSWPFIVRLIPKFTTDNRIRILKEGGLEHVSIGLQGSERLNRELYSRAQTNQRFIESCSILNRYGINYVVDVLLDNPYENEDDLREIAQTLNAVPKPFTVLAYGLTLFPGTALYEKVRKDGRENEFGTDPYRSMFKASRPDAYSTPLPWRNFIQSVVPQAPKEVVESILETGPMSREGTARIGKLAKRYEQRIKFGHTVKNFNPHMFKVALSLYRKLTRFRDAMMKHLP